MVAEKVSGYKSNDGTLHDTEEGADFSDATDLLLGLLRRAGGDISSGTAFRVLVANAHTAITSLHVLSGKARYLRGEVPLTAVNISILQGLAEGLSNKDLALQLGKAEGTIKMQVKRAMEKIGVNNRVKAALWAVRNIPGCGE